MKFYELQQQAGGRWKTVGYFLAEVNAEEHRREFNTTTSVSPLRIRKREFLDFGDWSDIKDFIK